MNQYNNLFQMRTELGRLLEEELGHLTAQRIRHDGVLRRATSYVFVLPHFDMIT